ncbi:MAG: class I SAM-dependent methyltransferase [Myxococcota bacterium]
MTTSGRNHWESVYTKKAADAVSWYARHLERSLAFIDATGAPADAAIIDVGAGASTLADDLVARGFRDLTLLDLSATALDVVRTRLGPRGESITWWVGDVTEVPLPGAAYDVWHDRAVFHFLTHPALRERYVAQVRHAVKPGGHVIVATFGLAGPERCSGLDVVRYDADGIHAAFGPSFVKVQSASDRHETPWGSVQELTYCYCRVTGPTT